MRVEHYKDIRKATEGKIFSYPWISLLERSPDEENN